MMSNEATAPVWNNPRTACWWCGGQLIWGGDHDISEEDDYFDMSSNLTCTQCQAHVIYYRPKDEED